MRQVNEQVSRTTYSAPNTIWVLKNFHLFQLILKVGQLVIDLLLARPAFLKIKKKFTCMNNVVHQEGNILLTAWSGFFRCIFVKASRPFVMSQCEHFNSVGGVPVQFMHVGRSALAGLPLFRYSRSLYIWRCRFEYLVCMRNLLQEMHWILRIIQPTHSLGVLLQDTGNVPGR